MRAMVVALDVGADRRPRLVEGLKLLAPDAALLELREPRLDERLAFRIAVAAAAVEDPVVRQTRPERARGERRPVSVPSVSSPAPTPRSATAASTTAVASCARQRTSSAQPTISRVQQSIAALR